MQLRCNTVSCQREELLINAAPIGDVFRFPNYIITVGGMDTICLYRRTVADTGFHSVRIHTYIYILCMYVCSIYIYCIYLDIYALFSTEVRSLKWRPIHAIALRIATHFAACLSICTLFISLDPHSDLLIQRGCPPDPLHVSRSLDCRHFVPALPWLCDVCQLESSSMCYWYRATRFPRRLLQRPRRHCGRPNCMPPVASQEIAIGFNRE